APVPACLFPADRLARPPGARRSRLAAGSGTFGLHDQPPQHGAVDGLRQMLVEARLERLPFVLFLGPAGQREETYCTAFRPRPNSPRHLVSVHLRQTDVEQDDVRPKRVDGAQGLSRAVNRLDFVTVELENETQARGRIAIVVDDEHAPSGPRGCGLLRLARMRAARRERQLDDELAASSEAGALRPDRAVMERHELSAQREADPDSAAARARAVLGHLAEHLEHVVELIHRDAVAVVLDADDRGVVLDSGRDPDRAADLGVLRGVAEQVAENLSQPLKIALDRKRHVPRRNLEPVPPLVDQRYTELDGGADHGAQIERRALEIDVAARHAGEIEQVVDEVNQMR